VDSNARNAGGSYWSTPPNMGHSPSVHRNCSVLVRNNSSVTRKHFECKGDFAPTTLIGVLRLFGGFLSSVPMDVATTLISMM
jgi:hypothetical protein